MAEHALPDQSSSRLDREQVEALRTAGEAPDDQRVTVRAGGVDVEGCEGRIEASVWPATDGVEVQVGDLRLIVKGKDVALLRQHRPFPITEWTVLYKGDVNGDVTDA